MRSTNLVPSPINIHRRRPEPPFTPFHLSAKRRPSFFSAVPESRRNFAGVASRRTEFVLFLTSANHRAETPSPATPATADSITVYGLQPHNISLNSVLAISNHVTLCEGHLRVPPELSLFQYYFSVKKEKVRQSTELATCGSITFMIRPGRVYPHPTATNPRGTGPRLLLSKGRLRPSEHKKFAAVQAAPPPSFRRQSAPISPTRPSSHAIRRICKLRKREADRGRT
ncbi:hypothetical protein QYE76_042558 [Lolium multiflorum]|uniref:Transposase (putative) gypsy type domain-containing protein n=1 Tax=Lolium multiflorum TaxID=4521 RepID=A0AAD8TF10_LOLMU|nr:hypothetical protein QYE76_042558 [Lolium multiflorum]